MSSSDPNTESTGPAAGAEDAVLGEPSLPRPREAAPQLSLTDFLDGPSLQEIQDGFTSLTRLVTTIYDADGDPVTEPTDAQDRDRSDHWLDHLLSTESGDGEPFAAPIVLDGQTLGSISIEPGRSTGLTPESRSRFRAAVERLNLTEEQVERIMAAAEHAFGANRAASVQFLYLLANSIARLCYQQYHARQRVEELSALYKVSTLISAHRDVQQVLDTAARSVAEVMQVKASSIRLLKEDAGHELVPRAVHQLSETYLAKGAIRCDQSEIFSKAIAGEVVYVKDLASDPRVVYPEDAQREGLVSMLCAGMSYQGRPIGVIQLFTATKRSFSQFEINLVKAMAHLLATAIENARLDQARNENQRMIRQLHLAADVQRRMLPGKMPSLPPFDIAARYVPSLELGGDFYDFINLDGHLGIAVGDVVGKGVAASLLMASVRASLRAYAQDLYDLDEVISRVNKALSRDTQDNEFATLWYGVLDPHTMRMTYCNAGHEPPLLLRRGRIYNLNVGGMIVGIDGSQQYEKGLWDVEAGDMILLYTDGLPDAANFEHQRFGRERIEQALHEAAELSAHDALNHILWCMRKFTGLRRSVDDTTLVVIKVGEKG
ncbi:MAG: SpoIIE family protein phosphatase [Phycisphaeraceae bacterium]